MEVVQVLEFGDDPGHPFRGNQYQSALGGVMYEKRDENGFHGRVGAQTHTTDKRVVVNVTAILKEHSHGWDVAGYRHNTQQRRQAETSFPREYFVPRKGGPADATTAAAVDLTTDDPPHDGVMIAWIASEDVGAQFVIDHPDAEPAQRMHMTIAYLGKASELDPSALVLADNVVRNFCASLSALPASVSGTGLFETPNDGTALVALIDSPDLPVLYVSLVAALEAVNLPVSHVHGFTPHVTLVYLSSMDTDLRAPAGLQFSIDNISLVVSDRGESFPLQ